MAGLIFDYLLQMLPIPLGIALMLLLRSAKGLGGRVRIVSNEAAETPIREERSESVEEPKTNDFSRIAYDYLIQNGIFVDRFRAREIRRVAFERLGMIDAAGLSGLGSCLKNRPVDELRILASDPKIVLNHLLDFNGNSGLLLSYLISYRLELI